MRDLLAKINETFDNSINTSSEDTALQLKILKGNINTLFNEAMEQENNNNLYHSDNINASEEIPVFNEIQEMKLNNNYDGVSVVAEPIEEIVEDKDDEVLFNLQRKEINNNSNLNAKSILIVDDSSIIRNYLEKACQTKYNCLMAPGGMEAISLIDSKHCDLILLDLMMPGIDGFGVLEHLRAKNLNIPVIIVSGDTTKESIDRAFQYNVVDMIEKPFSEKTIMSKIDRILD